MLRRRPRHRHRRCR